MITYNSLTKLPSTIQMSRHLSLVSNLEQELLVWANTEITLRRALPGRGLTWKSHKAATATMVRIEDSGIIPPVRSICAALSRIVQPKKFIQATWRIPTLSLCRRSTESTLDSSLPITCTFNNRRCKRLTPLFITKSWWSSQ